MKCADILIGHGADRNFALPSTLETPLHAAVNAKSLDLVDRLLRAGADCKKRDHNANTPLSVALSNNLSEIAALLRLHGAGDSG